VRSPAAPDWLQGLGETALQIALSRLVFGGAYLLAWTLQAQGLTTPEHDLPSWRALWPALVGGARNFGDYDWYRSVAQWGYSQVPYDPATGQQNWAFFPLQGLADRLVPSPGWQFAAGFAAFAGAVILLGAYLRRVLPREDAKLITALVCWFPFSYTLSEFRPETFLFLFSMAALALAARGQRWDASLAAGVAGLAKPNAFLLSLLLLPHAGEGKPSSRWRPSLPGLAMLAAPATGLVFMSLWLWHATGDPLAWVKIQKTWGANLGVQPLTQLHDLFAHPQVVGRGGWDPILMHWILLAAAAVGIGALVAAGQWVFALYALLYIAMTVSNFGVYVLGKHLSTCFPVFVGWAMLLRGRPSLSQGALLSFAALLAVNGVFAGLGLYYVKA
jgi:hypothetical protein